METINLFDYHPDAVFIMDMQGNIEQSNIQFQKTVSKTSLGVNFLVDILHSQHEEKFGMIIEQMQADAVIDSHKCMSLGVLKTLTMSTDTHQCKYYYNC